MGIEQFLTQLGDLQEEASRLDRADSPARSDWFSTHPFSPLRLRAAELFSQSEICGGKMSTRDLEAQVHELMTLMDPSYLQSKTDVAESMRRLLFAAGIAVAAASGKIGEPELKAVEELLGPGSLPSEISVEAITATLPKRAAAVVEHVPALRRVQVIRDLCLIAGADGRVTEREHRVISDVAHSIEVDLTHLENFLDDKKIGKVD